LYQLMRTEDLALCAVWSENWQELSSFTIVPVHTAMEAPEAMAAQRPTGRDPLPRKILTGPAIECEAPTG
jgi:hypothetical protein